MYCVAHRGVSIQFDGAECPLCQAVEQSADVQLNWASPVEKEGARLEIERLRAEVERLLVALENYGRHLERCAVNREWGADCTCGLKDALDPGVDERRPRGE